MTGRGSRGSGNRPRSRSTSTRTTVTRSGGRTTYRRPPRRHNAAWLLALVALLAVLGWLAKGMMDRRSDAGTTTAETTNTTNGILVRVTFPEGLRREDMAQILADKAGMSASEYLEATASGPRGQKLAGTDEPRSLEGFLFPATYDVRENTTLADIIDQQLQAYANNTADIDYSYAESRNLTRYDVLIIASMIEREVRDPDERALVAGVIYNRLKRKMRLDIDATVQYALGEWKKELTASDLAVDSPYNTRKYSGMPPGPIASPGAASIAAAARPKGDFLYYVARNDGTGRHYFARNDAEFQQFVAQSRANAGG